MSTSLKNSLIHLRNFKKQDVIDLFERASFFEKQKNSFVKTDQTAALIFFEASTRTRMSFETASVRLGLHPMILSGKASSSLEKGESFEDTVLNIAALNPALLIIRTDDSLDLNRLEQRLALPILNAGWGTQGHPSQALLDAFTIWRKKGTLEKERVLIIGDVGHSRVAASHFELSKIMNYEVALCGPQNFMPTGTAHAAFSNLEEALGWATVAMALRVQNERHSKLATLTSYADKFGLNTKNKKFISQGTLIMHPGPINHGIEMDLAVMRDQRSVILEQVINGVYIRQALLERALNGGTR